jgi:hypothetical protein
MKSTSCMQIDRGDFRSCFYVDLRWPRISFDAALFVIDLLPDLSLQVLAQRHCACSLNAFAHRFAQHPSLRLRVGFSHFLAHACVRSNVQMDCPERTMSQAWLALIGRQAAWDAALTRHRRPVPLGRGKVQGKIEGSGTLPAHKRVCTWGWRGTRYLAAPCREVRQSLVGIGETACIARSSRMGLAGVSA